MAKAGGQRDIVSTERMLTSDGLARCSEALDHAQALVEHLYDCLCEVLEADDARLPGLAGDDDPPRGVAAGDLRAWKAIAYDASEHLARAQTDVQDTGIPVTVRRGPGGVQVTAVDGGVLPWQKG